MLHVAIELPRTWKHVIEVYGPKSLVSDVCSNNPHTRQGLLYYNVGLLWRTMTSRVGAFHHKHGSNVRLLENGTVAHRVESYNKAVVFTERPISVGAMYKVKLLDKGGGWAGSIVSHVMLIFLIVFFLL